MNIMKMLITALIATVSLTSCASIVNGPTQKIPVNSYPNGATVNVDGRQLGQTPTVVEVSRKTDHTLSVYKPGYQQRNVHLKRSVSGWVAGNLLVGGVIGGAADAVTGSMYKINPEAVNVQLDLENNYR
jgi:PEGA domain